MTYDFKPYLSRIEQVIQSSLPHSANPQWISGAFGSVSDSLKTEHFSALLEPTSSLVSLGGKRWRPLLLVLSAEACAKKLSLSEEAASAVKETAFSLTPLVEFIHTASLIHDDIEDSSDTRRGQPAAYITYGTDIAINAGTWLAFLAPECISRTDCDIQTKNRLYFHYLRETRRLHLGQAMDITWHKNRASLPSIDEYLSMVKLKTGTLSSLSVRIGTLTAGADEELCSRAALLASDIGAGFQIIDDVINLTTGNPGKIRGDDIVEEKKSLPVLLFAQKNPSGINELFTLFDTASKEGIKSPAVEKAIKLLTESGAVENALSEGKKLIHESCASFEQLFKNEEAQKITSLFTSMSPEIKT